MTSAPDATTPASATERIEQFVHPLANGLTLVAERIPGVRSAAMTLLVPVGAATDPAGASGSATVLSDWLLRGAGDRDSRDLTSHLDSLGVQRGSGAETMYLRFSASMLAKNLAAVLPVYGDIVQRPQLPDDGFEPSVDLAIQQLDAIEDEPSHKLGLLLRQQHYDYPFGRPSVGIKSELETLSAQRLRADALARLTPAGSILAVAGIFDFPALKDAVEKAFAGWDRKPAPTAASALAPRGVLHDTRDTNQVQIGLGYDSVPESHPDSILVQTANAVMSGGMGARLFSEIREKQGLCYSVQAGYHSLKHIAAIFGYAGTAPDRAQQTLDSFLVELRRLKDGVTQDEFDRAITGMKSRVIMQGESSSARAGAIAYDFYHRGRPRSLAEVRTQIEGVTLKKVNDYVAAHPPGALTVVTIGPKPLEVV